MEYFGLYLKHGKLNPIRVVFLNISMFSLSCGGLFLFFVFNSGSSSISDRTIHVIYGVFTSVTALGIILLGLLRMPSTIDETRETAPSLPPAQEIQLTQWELLRMNCFFSFKLTNVFNLESTLKLCTTKRMLLLIVAFMYTGIELSFWSGIYPTCISFTEKLAPNTKIIVALNAITQGLGQATGK